MNKYEVYLAAQPQPKNRLRVGMHVVLMDGQRYTITNESEGHYWGGHTSPSLRPSRYQGWHWTEDGQFYRPTNLANIDWVATERLQQLQQEPI